MSSPLAVLPALDASTSQFSPMNLMVAFGIMFVSMYFIAIRPQQQEKKAQDALLAALAKDDQVVTTGGMYGKVVEVQGETLVLEISEKTRVKIDRSAIARKAGTPAPKK